MLCNCILRCPWSRYLPEWHRQRFCQLGLNVGESFDVHAAEKFSHSLGQPEEVFVEMLAVNRIEFGVHEATGLQLQGLLCIAEPPLRRPL